MKKFFPNRAARYLCIHLVVLCVISSIIVSCSGEGGSNGESSGTAENKTGTFEDSLVNGLKYVADNAEGLTELGKFEYRDGDSISFFIGDVRLGSTVLAKAKMTPMDLVPEANQDLENDTLTNIARLLQCLDLNGDLTDGIEITESMHNEIEGRNLNFAQSVEQFESSVTVESIFNSLSAIGVYSEKREITSRTCESVREHLRFQKDAATLNVSNESYQTECAEEDNINLPFNYDQNVSSFKIIATHPTYTVESYNCDADFTSCDLSGDTSYSFDNPGTFKLFDDGNTYFEAIREASWWQPNGMSVRINQGDTIDEIHYIRVGRKISDADSWPQFLVLYQDGNLRLIPHPTTNSNAVCFGSSIIIGPAEKAKRPIAAITAIQFISANDTLKLTYDDGSTVNIVVEAVNREKSVLAVNLIEIQTPSHPLLTFRSMYVEPGNTDADTIKWYNATSSKTEDILSFTEGVGSRWRFYRRVVSKHNQSAPDIEIQVCR